MERPREETKPRVRAADLCSPALASLGLRLLAGEKGLAIALVGPREWNLMESIERYLGLSFQARAIPGLKAEFTGPGKRKGPHRSASKARTAPAADKPKVKDRERDRKAIGKRRKPTTAGEAGLSPLRKKQ